MSVCMQARARRGYGCRRGGVGEAACGEVKGMFALCTCKTATVSVVLAVGSGGLRVAMPHLDTG
jgi:hypothetical protein